MPLPIVIFATAQVAAEAASTSLWVYAGGAAGTAISGGGIYYYRDSIYRWWFPKGCDVLPENDPIKKQSVLIQVVQQRVVETQVKLEKTSEVKASILIDTKQDAEKIEGVVSEVENINVVEIETFESLLKKITDSKSEKLDNVLGALETLKDSLTLDQIKIIQTVTEITKENQLLREANQNQQRIVIKLDKINAVLQQKLLRFEELIEVKNSSPIISVGN